MKKNTKYTKKRKNSKQFNRKFKKTFFTKKAMIILGFTFVILAAFAIAYQNVQTKAARYEKAIEELKTEIKDIEQTNQTLEEEKDNLDTDEFKERIARERLGMIGKDEYSLQQEEDSGGESTESSASADSPKSSGMTESSASGTTGK